MRRFCRLDIQRDLFGLWTLTREWGRIGSKGQQMISSYLSEEAASGALEQKFAGKTRRGYDLPWSKNKAQK